MESKTSVVARYLAGRLLDVQLGERIPTTAHLASKLEVGFGTIEKALNALRDQQIIKTRSRGQMGTFLLERDMARQWKAAGLGTVIGLLPLPNAMPFIGLATGLTEWFDETGVPFAINFKNGAESRMTALAEGRADLVAMSKRSADRICAAEGAFTVLMHLPPASYYVGHDIIYRRDCSVDRSTWRIGVDPTSFDHVEFCRDVFPGASTRDVRYINLPYAIAKGEIDASVLHSRALVPMEFASLLVAEPAAMEAGLLTAASACAFVARKDNRALHAVFERAGGATSIHETQRAVMSRQKEPAF